MDCLLTLAVNGGYGVPTSLGMLYNGQSTGQERSRTFALGKSIAKGQCNKLLEEHGKASQPLVSFTRHSQIYRSHVGLPEQEGQPRMAAKGSGKVESLPGRDSGLAWGATVVPFSSPSRHRVWSKPLLS